MGSMARKEIVLIPWDPESPEHRERLYQQRIACGWYENYVEGWQERQRSGKVSLQWIVLADEAPARQAKLAAHVKAFPLEATPIADTATLLAGKPRTPFPARSFIPVGHMSLNARGEDLSQPECYKIAYFYITTALQGGGLGRAAMDAIESSAVCEPFCTKTLCLTANAIIQLDPPPKSESDKATFCTQRWYASRGYEAYEVVPRKWKRMDPDGVERWNDAVNMRKSMA